LYTRRLASAALCPSQINAYPVRQVVVLPVQAPRNRSSCYRAADWHRRLFAHPRSMPTLFDRLLFCRFKPREIGHLVIEPPTPVGGCLPIPDQRLPCSTGCCFAGSSPEKSVILLSSRRPASAALCPSQVYAYPVRQVVVFPFQAPRNRSSCYRAANRRLRLFAHPRSTPTLFDMLLLY